MTDNSKTDNRSQTEVFPSVSKAIGSISGDDRIKTLIYAFKKALEAGKTECSKDFNSKAAIDALEHGSLQLRGTQEQIAGQLVLIRGAASVLQRALDYEEADTAAPIRLPSENEDKPRPQPIKSGHIPKR